jgi:Peptidase family C25
MPAANVDKVIVTNLAQLKAKYQAAGVAAIKTAIAALITADDGRGLKTVLVDLSSAAAMKKFEGEAVSAPQANDPESNKDAVDKIFAATQPAYLLLLGAPDVIAHQDLDNPLLSDQDTDEFAYSDLPYACDAAYSQDIRKFLAPTRVVGRLPDVVNATDPAYLVGLLQTATSYTQRPASDYDNFLGISTDTWQGSTDESLRAIFGTSAAMNVVPPAAPPWTATVLGARAHFINCHGAPATHQFFGEEELPEHIYPVSHDATQIPGNLAAGTVMSAECCYGAELYDPVIDDGQMGMCNTYLGNGAYAYFGSSTIAYGPPTGNDQADLICQDFLKNIRSGFSAGRACLQARLDYVSRSIVMAPFDLKTLAQFGLMGDPALTPVQSIDPAPHVLPKGIAAKADGPKALAAATSALDRVGRASRRATIAEMARSAVASTLVVAKSAVVATAKGTKSLRDLATQFGLTAPSVISLAITGGAAPKAKNALAKAFAAGGAAVPTAVHTMLERQEHESPAIRIKGVEVVEYSGTYEARVFFSR